MAGFLRRLADPQLVSDIQRFCGVRPAKPSYESSGISHGGHCSSAAVDSSGDSPTVNGVQANIHGNHQQTNYDDIRRRIVKQNGFTSLNGSSSHEDGGPTQNGNGVGPENGHALPSLEQHPLDSYTEKAAATIAKEHIDQDGVTPSDCFAVDNKLLYLIFRLGAELGNESFYIIFYPYFFWNIDSWMARRVCWFWSLFMYAGQTAKDLIKWPRPASPPVFRLEKKYAFEYGMPSTHAMVGVGLPFLTFILTTSRYEYNWQLGLAGTICWCALVCFSRLYLGMHSVLDVLAGIAFCALLLPIWLCAMNSVDDFLMTHPYAPLFAVSIPLIMCLNYPKLEQWNTCRSDTTLVVGTGAGVAVALWINYQYGLMTRQTTSIPFAMQDFTLSQFGEDMYRMLIGGIIALITRLFLKFVTYRSSCWCFGLDPNDPQTKQEFCIELPVKFGTYFVLSLVVVVLTPIIFARMGIGRASLYTEL